MRCLAAFNSTASFPKCHPFRFVFLFRDSHLLMVLCAIDATVFAAPAAPRPLRRARAASETLGRLPKYARQAEKQKTAPKNSNKSNKNNKNNKNNKTKNTKPTQEDREPMPLKEQEDAVIEFLQGVIASFHIDASASTRMEEERIIGSIDGEDVGLLIGPKAGTLLALQDITRTVVQRHASGKKTNRLSVDVGGYREKRKASLVAFTQKQAELVKENNEKVELEPMGAADRKIVHDAAAEISGISSSSDGEEPRRYVVLHPSE